MKKKLKGWNVEELKGGSKGYGVSSVKNVKKLERVLKSSGRKVYIRLLISAKWGKENDRRVAAESGG